MVVRPVETIKDLTAQRSIEELPAPKHWCKFRKWTAENAYTLIFLALMFVVTWILQVVLYVVS